MYDLPKTNTKKYIVHFLQNPAFQVTALVFIIIVCAEIMAGNISLQYFQEKTDRLVEYFSPRVLTIEEQITAPSSDYVSTISYEQAIISAVKSASPSVVSITISKNVPVYEQEMTNPLGDLGNGLEILVPQYIQKGTKLQEVGSGSGFFVSADGLILTNKHVVSDKTAKYTVVDNDGKKYTAKVLALDPVQDLAIIKITDEKKFPAIRLGDSSGIQLGQGAIAIGNALGEYSNTISVGVISGLGRTITASDQAGSFSENLEDIIQTDAAINFGNSGGPLINLKGEVIGINTATAQDAQTVGFAIPINLAKRDIGQVIKGNKISYPFLGVRYVLVDDDAQKKYKLPVDYGAYVFSDNGQAAITKGSAADKAGIKKGDIIVEFGGEKITSSNSLSKMIARLSPDDKVMLKVLRGGEEIMVEVTLGER